MEKEKVSAMRLFCAEKQFNDSGNTQFIYNFAYQDRDFFGSGKNKREKTAEIHAVNTDTEKLE